MLFRIRNVRWTLLLILRSSLWLRCAFGLGWLDPKSLIIHSGKLNRHFRDEIDKIASQPQSPLVEHDLANRFGEVGRGPCHIDDPIGGSGRLRIPLDLDVIIK